MKKKTNDEKPIIDIVREETQKVFNNTVVSKDGQHKELKFSEEN